MASPLTRIPGLTRRIAVTSSREAGQPVPPRVAHQVTGTLQSGVRGTLSALVYSTVTVLPFSAPWVTLTDFSTAFPLK